MTLEGTVTNVAAFGAFVDIGVHQDGLVHVSQLADRFVKDPHEVVKAGDVVKVRVVDIDIKRNRIGLTMRKHDGDVAAPRQTSEAFVTVAQYGFADTGPRKPGGTRQGRRATGSPRRGFGGSAPPQIGGLRTLSCQVRMS